MASDEFKKEYGQHLVDQVLKGQMTRRQLLVRASVFGFSMTAAGSLLAACGGTSCDTALAGSQRQQRARPRHGRHPDGRHPAVDHRHGPGRRSTTRAASSSSSRCASTSSPSTTRTASSRAWLRAGRATPTPPCGPSSCARASSSTTAAPWRPPTWSPASSAWSTPRAVPAPSPRSRASSRPGGTKASRHRHRRVHARQAVRRLPVPGLPVVVQHGDPAA